MSSPAPAYRFDLPGNGVSVDVSAHAQWRAAERFRICHAEQIETEVCEAFAAGRVSTEKPPGVLNATDPEALYAWTPSGNRVYVVKVNRFTAGTTFAVLTVLRPWGDRRA